MDAEQWDARYADKELIWSAEPNQFLPPAVEGMRPGRALDLACGEGRNAIWLARHGWYVLGVDFSSVAIRKAKQLAGKVAVDWQVADVTALEPDPSFDLVLVFYAHLDPGDLEDLFSVATGSLAPGGRLFAVGHAVRNLEEGTGGPPYEEILWDAEAIEPWLGGLQVTELGERLRPVEGAERPAIDLVVDATRAA
ncbi:MAG: class I SAM-dependent methyltransferase [Acidimicrobiia bacterium]